MIEDSDKSDLLQYEELCERLREIKNNSCVPLKIDHSKRQQSEIPRQLILRCQHKKTKSCKFRICYEQRKGSIVYELKSCNLIHNGHETYDEMQGKNNKAKQQLEDNRHFIKSEYEKLLRNSNKKTIRPKELLKYFEQNCLDIYQQFSEDYQGKIKKKFDNIISSIRQELGKDSQQSCQQQIINCNSESISSDLEQLSSTAEIKIEQQQTSNYNQDTSFFNQPDSDQGSINTSLSFQPRSDGDPVSESQQYQDPKENFIDQCFNDDKNMLFPLND